MKKKLQLINLLSLFVKSILAIGFINNPIVSSKAASNQIFIEQEKITSNSTDIKEINITSHNNTMVNSKLASDVSLKFNTQANTNLKQINHNVNNSVINSRLASNLIFTTHNDLS